MTPTDKVVPAVPFAAGVSDDAESEQFTVLEEGEIEQVSPTAELKPLSDVTVIREVVVPLATGVVAEAGAAVMLKLLTLRTNGVEIRRAPELPLTVTV